MWNELFSELENIPHVDHEDGFQISYYEKGGVWDESSHVYRLQMSPLVNKAREIASMEHCDWGLDYSQGFDMLMPHIGHMLKVQRMLQYSMRGEIDMGNTNAAIAVMDSMFGITRHNKETKTLIGSLVSNTCFDLATSDKNLIDNTDDIEQLETLLASVDQFEARDPFGLRANVGSEKEMTLNWLRNEENPDFSIFDSITGNQTDVSGLDMDEEIKLYSSAMERMETVFQMTDKDAAIAASDKLDSELSDGSLGYLSMVLSPSMNLLKFAFRQEETVSGFKQLLQNKIDMIRNPNSATYFLRAVEAYNAIDEEERRKAIEQGDFLVIEEPISLFAKASSMPVKQITLADTPETPAWVAPLYSLALDCLASGTPENHASIVEFIGHMSMQKRFASSIVAGKLFSMLRSNEVPIDLKNIPTADAFGLHGSAQSDRKRLKEYFEIDEAWDPSNANILSMTFVIAIENGIANSNLEAWSTFTEAIGLPDDDPIIVAIHEEWIPDSLQLVVLDQEPLFNEMMKSIRVQIALVLKSTPPRGR